MTVGNHGGWKVKTYRFAVIKVANLVWLESREKGEWDKGTARGETVGEKKVMRRQNFGKSEIELHYKRNSNSNYKRNLNTVLLEIFVLKNFMFLILDRLFS